ncbi:MAG: PH domain-containing protein [Gemmataceae bacterium]|nr:PH domain-containing protein [Gemmataceae bacterium]
MIAAAAIVIGMDIRHQAVTGVIAPELAEARIREVYPSVARCSAVASLGKMLTRTIIGAPLAWLLMSACYFSKVLPVTMTRYTLTNRRLMIRKGWKGIVKSEVPLSQIDDVRLAPGSVNDFFRAADLEIISQGQVVMRLAGVPDPESFRHAILSACSAWVPGKAKNLPFLAASAAK